MDEQEISITAGTYKDIPCGVDIYVGNKSVSLTLDEFFKLVTLCVDKKLKIKKQIQEFAASLETK